MVGCFCTYCGKSFTRKEHLERHIPSHTNVKPHRCGACQLSFARRDLLQRHQASYHEVQDMMQNIPGRTPQMARRTPIACLNCANAKAGCDKNVPCTRCYEKNLPCEARYARRISKVAVRAAASASASAPISPVHDRIPPQLRQIDVNMGGSQYGDPQLISPRSTMHQSTLPTPGPCDGMQFSDKNLYGPELSLDNTGMMDFGESFHTSPSLDFQDFLSWGGEYPMVVDNFNNADLSSQLENFDMPLCELSESNSSSYGRHSNSSRTSVSTAHTRQSSNACPTPALSPSASKSLIDPRIKSSTAPDFEAVIAAEDAWPIARCNKPIFSDTCPRTAIVHLETLEHNSQNLVTWSSLIPDSQEMTSGSRSPVSVVPLNSATRDKILAITQSFLHKALSTHRSGFGWPKSSSNHPSPGGGFSFLVLPPAETLEYFLQSYARSFTSFFSLINGGTVDPNELMLNNQASTLLLLLMLAQGACSIASNEARQLTAGLTETCRISLFDLIEKDVELSADPIVLRCALLFTLLAAWGGDKWHMDIAMGQRGMYLAMLKHSGMMEPQPPFNPIFDNCTSKDLQWRTWVKRETKIRLVYNWVMVDQELSLFHDTPCVLSTTELQTPIPSEENLWLARDADEWLAAFYASRDRPERRASSPGSTSYFAPSIGDLFQDLLHDNIRSHGHLSPLQLKLLLHPLHSLVSHVRDVLTCFSDSPGSHRGNRTITKASTMSRLEEVQSLLQKWYGLCIFHAGDESASPIIQENLILYHLISLNAVTSFPDIERVARKEFASDPNSNTPSFYKRCIYRREEALFHCGQVFRLVNAMANRPHWWSTAIYRATMIVWVYSLSQAAAGQHKPANNETIFAIDAVTPEHPSVTSYLWNGEGLPVLSRKDGGVTALDQPGPVLVHCANLLTEGISGRMSDGIRRKLQTLHRNWCFDTPETFV